MARQPATYRYRSASVADTRKLAGYLAEWAAPGTVLALDGDLGAGKTAFSQAYAKALGVKGTVNSPTFTIIKEYEGHSLPLFHMDVYRIGEEEAAELGLDEYFYGKGATLIEWAEKVEDLLPPNRLHVHIANTGPEERLFTLTPFGLPYEHWCQILRQNGALQ